MNNSTVILANDPDADRLAVAEKQSEGWVADWLCEPAEMYTTLHYITCIQS
jgi:hypothetical protein